MSLPTKAPTFNWLQEQKIVKRADSQKALIQNIHILDGFNARFDTQVYKDSILGLASKILAGLQVGPLECAPGVNGPEVVDGHTRYMAHHFLHKQGIHPDAKKSKIDGEPDELWLDFFPSKAKTMFERRKRIAETQDNRKLEGPEMGSLYRAMMQDVVEVDGVAVKVTMEMIAKEMGKTRAHVEQMLKLDAVPDEVKASIMTGEISSSTVVELARAHGDNVAAVVADEIDKAKGMGKSKVTKATMSTPKPPRKLLEEITTYCGEIVSGLSQGDKETLVKYQKGTISEGTVSMPVGRLLAMSLALEELERLNDEIAAKLRESENKKKQTEADV